MFHQADPQINMPANFMRLQTILYHESVKLQVLKAISGKHIFSRRFNGSTAEKAYIYIPLATFVKNVSIAR